MSDTSASTNRASAPIVLARAVTAVTVDVADQHLCAFGGEASHQALAQPGRAAGDDRDLARQFVLTMQADTFAAPRRRKSRQAASLTADGCSICGQ